MASLPAKHPSAPTVESSPVSTPGKSSGNSPLGGRKSARNTSSPGKIRAASTSSPSSSAKTTAEASPYARAKPVNPPILVVALADYPIANEDARDLHFKQGDEIQCIGKFDDGWWVGTCEGLEGMFPSSYVIDASEMEAVLQSPSISAAAATAPATKAEKEKSARDATSTDQDKGLRFLDRVKLTAYQGTPLPPLHERKYQIAGDLTLYAESSLAACMCPATAIDTPATNHLIELSRAQVATLPSIQSKARFRLVSFLPKIFRPVAAPAAVTLHTSSQTSITSSPSTTLPPLERGTILTLFMYPYSDISPFPPASLGELFPIEGTEFSVAPLVTSKGALWVFKDGQGREHGPFPSSEMRLWFDALRFAPTTLIKNLRDVQFVRLIDMVDQLKTPSSQVFASELYVPDYLKDVAVFEGWQCPVCLCMNGNEKYTCGICTYHIGDPLPDVAAIKQDVPKEDEGESGQLKFGIT